MVKREDGSRSTGDTFESTSDFTQPTPPRVRTRRHADTIRPVCEAGAGRVPGGSRHGRHRARGELGAAVRGRVVRPFARSGGGTKGQSAVSAGRDGAATRADRGVSLHTGGGRRASVRGQAAGRACGVDQVGQSGAAADAVDRVRRASPHGLATARVSFAPAIGSGRVRSATRVSVACCRRCLERDGRSCFVCWVLGERSWVRYKNFECFRRTHGKFGSRDRGWCDINWRSGR